MPRHNRNHNCSHSGPLNYWIRYLKLLALKTLGNTIIEIHRNIWKSPNEFLRPDFKCITHASITALCPLLRNVIAIGNHDFRKYFISWAHKIADGQWPIPLLDVIFYKLLLMNPLGPQHISQLTLSMQQGLKHLRYGGCDIVLSHIAMLQRVRILYHN